MENGGNGKYIAALSFNSPLKWSGKFYAKNALCSVIQALVATTRQLDIIRTESEEYYFV